MKFLFLLHILLLAGCSPEAPKTGGASSVERKFTPPDFKIGDLTKEGRLIFWSRDAFDHVEPFVLWDECGVVLVNDGNEEKPVARYIFACQKTREIVDTKDFAVFKEALSRVPKGTVVGMYDTCSVPRWYGLSEAEIAKFHKAITRAGLKMNSETTVVCYCPMGG